MKQPGDQHVETTDGLVHLGNHKSRPRDVSTPCGRWVCVFGLGEVRDRSRGMEAGTPVEMAPTCVVCVAMAWLSPRWRDKPMRGAY